jgi:hypothetical protein
MLTLLLGQSQPTAGRISVFGFWCGGFGGVDAATTPWLYVHYNNVIGG